MAKFVKGDIVAEIIRKKIHDLHRILCVLNLMENH